MKPATLLKIAAVALFLAVIPVWPYPLYMLLRLLVCVSAAYLAIKLKETPSLISHRFPLIVIAILFNPLLPVYLVRMIWLPIDLAIGIYFIFLINKLKDKDSNVR